MEEQDQIYTLRRLLVLTNNSVQFLRKLRILEYGLDLHHLAGLLLIIVIISIGSLLIFVASKKLKTIFRALLAPSRLVFLQRGRNNLLKLNMFHNGIPSINLPTYSKDPPHVLLCFLILRLCTGSRTAEQCRRSPRYWRVELRTLAEVTSQNIGVLGEQGANTTDALPQLSGRGLIAALICAA